MSKLAVLAVLTAAILAVSCSGGDAGQPSLLFGDAGGIIQQPATGDEPTTLIAVPSPTDTFRDPSVSPDGKRIAYVHAPPYKRAGAGYLDAHSDLWIAERDGSLPKMVHAHTRPTETLRSPQWLDDSTILMQMTYREDPATTGSPHVRALIRLDLESGERTEIASDIVEFAIAPDGSRIAYTRIDSIEEQPIYIASADSVVSLLVGYDSGLAAFSGLVFSEDGSALYFGAHREEEVRLAASSFASASTGASLRSSAHDAPVDLWAIDVGGGEPRQVAELEATAPTFSRGASAGELYILAGWLARIDLETGEVSRIIDPDVNGSLSFAAD